MLKGGRTIELWHAHCQNNILYVMCNASWQGVGRITCLFSHLHFGLSKVKSIQFYWTVILVIYNIYAAVRLKSVLNSNSI